MDLSLPKREKALPTAAARATCDTRGNTSARRASRLSDMVRPTVGAPQQLVQPRRRFFLHPGKDVRIRIHRQRNRRVPEHLLYHLRMLAVDESYPEFLSHRLSSPHATRVFGLPLGLTSPLLALSSRTQKNRKPNHYWAPT